MRIRLILTLFIVFSLHLETHAQAPGVPVYKEGRGSRAEPEARKTAQELRAKGELIDSDKVAEQLASRLKCKITLPNPSALKLTSRELFERARKGHMRVGWFYEDKKPARSGAVKPEPTGKLDVALEPKAASKNMMRWRFNLSGGFVLTSDGAVATCFHVAAPLDDETNGYLVAVDDEGHLYPVTEILAASQDTDTCIVRIKAEKLTPLPLSTDVVPGDKSLCFSEPMGKRGFYSEGIVNRFFARPLVKVRKKDPPPEHTPIWIEVSNDWAMGSSGSAVLDERGNAIGHVCEIAPVVDDQVDLTAKKHPLFPGTVIIFHDAIAAQQVLALIEGARK